MIANPYLNFEGKTEEAFRFYQSIFGGELNIQYMHQVPDFDVPEEEKNYVMHASIPLGKNQLLMASDCLKSAGQTVTPGNNNYICLIVDSRDEADRLFHELSVEGEVEMPMEDMFWGDYFGSLNDQFGVRWMICFENPKEE
ncbi:VOC family protein [Sphingobacterium corticibacter]|uniref:VOC family protein n=1 Tax=Sphingobacterium corticibacter TaxID=2171749 RepID=A0A2T8HKZ9_9SPHI|nr:VOC family protein [Sphingobacterium corticibacter]PVH26124.1 VOC family protein [Sphingobacterium corticibacter]